MIGRGIETLVFEEPLGILIPECVEVVAACCWGGFRLVRPPQPSLENVVVGCKRLPQFKDARRSSLRREMRWHFGAKQITAFHDRFGVRGFAKRWAEDVALRTTIKGHPAFDKWHSGLLDAVRKQPLVALATEGNRACYGKFQGDATTLKAMHEFMEEGGI